MEERVLFHLRLPSLGEDDVDGKSQASPETAFNNSGTSTSDHGSALICTSIHCSSDSTVAVGFKHGLVHIYRRVLSNDDRDDDDRHNLEGARWCLTVVEPTTALTSGRSVSSTASLSPDVTCLAVSPFGDMLALGTSNGYLFVMPTPGQPNAAGGGSGGGSQTPQTGRGGFHHKSHGGRRINCVLWDNGGDRLFSVCEGGTVVMVRNLRPRREAPAPELSGMTGVMSFLGIQQPLETKFAANVPLGPEAFIVGKTGSPGVQLDLGRTDSILPAVRKGHGPRSCDVLLVMTRKRAVLLYFAVGEDVSMVAPYQTSVDLNVIEHFPDNSSSVDERASSAGTPILPPSRADLGACLWGPARSLVGDEMPPRDGREEPQWRGSQGRKAFQAGALAAAAVGTAQPRPVSFAYVAQPGGKLWRVALSDGEVDSTYRPLGIAHFNGCTNKNGSTGQGLGGASAESGEIMEIGQLWPVYVGDLESQVILCWRNRQGSDSSGEFALLDPKTHRFVASCPALPSMVNLSGSLLVPSTNPALRQRTPESAMLQEPSALREAIRVLHGEHAPNVTQLCLAQLPHQSDRDSASGGGLLSWPISNNDAAMRIQRAWMARKARQDERLLELRHSLPNLDDHPSASQYGGEPVSPVRGVAMDDSSEGNVDDLTHSTCRKRQRSMERREAASRKAKFSIHESLEALDAADRVLQLSAPSNSASGGSKDFGRWYQGEVPRDGDLLVDAGEPLDSGSAKARALMRDTDALIRQTWPVLRRVRSSDPVSSPSISPRGVRMSTSFPSSWETRKQVLRAAAAQGVEADRPSMTTVHRGASERVVVSPGGPSSSPGAEGQHKPRSRSLDKLEADSSPTEFLAAPTTMPYPRGSSSDSPSRWDSPDFHRFRDKQRRGSPPSTQNVHSNNLFGPVQNMWGNLLQRSVQAVNDALQPGGGATSDSTFSDDRDDKAFARQRSHSDYGGRDGGLYGSDASEDALEVDGGMTSDTAKQSWGVSSDKSEFDSRNNSVHSMTKPSNHSEIPSTPEKVTQDINKKEEERKRHENKHMLFSSGMMGVKRQSLGKLRSRREAMVGSSPAVVMELPSSAMDDPSPFIPPSQYEVRLNVSKGLGLSLNITGNDVRVKGFSPVQGGEIGPAQASGQIQIGDALVRVNHRQLTLLNHDAVVSVLRGVVNTSADQLVLLRFEYAEDTSALPMQMPMPPRSSVQTQPPPITRQSSQGSLASHTGMGVANDGMNTDGFRSESWHGSRNPGRQGQRQGGKSGATPCEDNMNKARRFSHTLGETKTEGSPMVGSGVDGIGLNRMSDRSDRRMRTSGAAAALSEGNTAGDDDGANTGGASAFGGTGGMKGRNKRQGRLWGESEVGVGLGGGCNHHVYLGDMGLAQAQKTLEDIARDIQSLHRISHAAEEARFFHGRGKPSLTDLSATSVESRTPPPSAMLKAAPSPSSPRPSPVGNAFGGFDSPPPLPRDLYRGRRRRRPRRRRSYLRYHGMYGVAGEFRGGGVGEEADLSTTIDLPACREVVRGELVRLEKDLERLTARLTRQNRWSDVRSLVARLVTPSSSHTSALSLRAPRRRRSTDASWEGTSGYSNTSLRVWDMPEIDAVDDSWSDFLSVSESAPSMSSTVWGWGAGVGEAKRDRERGSKMFQDGKEIDTEISTACDIFLEAVSTANLEGELLETLAPEFMCVDPPRPLPDAAFDLQTALESVQHFATQTLSGVVQAQAVRGTSEEFSTGTSPLPMGGGQSRAKEAREAAAAAGLREEWELWWPPRELTAALALVTARQMANAMRCDAGPLIQIWMRCFTPLDVQHREKVWGALAPSPQDNLQVYQGRWHRQLVCGLVTLFAQVHISWPFLGRPSDDPAAVGLNSLKLETCWFSACDIVDNRQRADSVRVGDCDVEDLRVDDTNQSSEGPGVPSTPAPEQWDTRKVMEFIQDYGSYLEADTIAAAVSCRAMEEPLKEVFKLAEQCGDYKARERMLHQLLRGQQTSLPRSPNASPILRSPSSTPGSRTPNITSPRDPTLTDFRVPSVASPSAVDAALRAQARPPGALEEEAVRKALGLPIRRGDAPATRSMRSLSFQRDTFHRMEEAGRLEGARSGGDEPLGSAPLCLLLKNLGDLFRWDTSAAADICADAFPGVRPWNVHCALHDDQEKPWSTVEPPTPLARGAKVNSKYSMGDDAAIRKDAAFQAYLWAMMDKHPTVCRKDWKMVQRCLQLSLRLATRLRSLPPDHPLQVFCRVATRSVKYRRRRAESGCGVVGLMEAVPMEKPSFASPRNSRESQRDENTPLRTKPHIREGVEVGGRAFEDAVWWRYSEMVQDVVCTWCRDQETYHLDPLWLLAKLRDWPLAFKVCGVVARSWEEWASSGVCPSEVWDSIKTVFGTLAEACFNSFEGSDTKTLAAAIAAVWAADGAFRRACKACKVFEGFGENCLAATQSREEVAHQGEEEECLPAIHDGGRSNIMNLSDSLAHSKMLDIVRRLTLRCVGLQGTVEGPGGSDVKADDNMEGVDVRVDVPVISKLSALELAEAILDGVGPETTGNVLSACPPLLDNMPPKFFRTLADRQANLLRQQALETELSRRAAAAVWATRGNRSRVVGRGPEPDGGRGHDLRERSSPLGPRLAWLAVEELTSFFRRDHDNLPDSAMLPLPYLTNNAGGATGADQSASHEEEHVKNAVARAGVNLILPRSTHRGVALRPDSPCLFCGIPLKGCTRSPSAAALNGGTDVGVIGAGDVVGTRRDNDAVFASGEELHVVVKPCGHGFHAVCLQEGLEGSTGWDASWWGVCEGGGMCCVCSERA